MNDVIFTTDLFPRSDASRECGATYCERLDDMLPMSDYVVISCPLTDETNGLIGEKQFKLMKKTAILVNIGRGNITRHISKIPFESNIEQ